jgi:hypothetical protein
MNEQEPKWSLPRVSDLRGDQQPIRHRVSLSDGRVISGMIFRSPRTRLIDHLHELAGSGYLGVAEAEDERGRKYAFLAINLAHIVSVEEGEILWKDAPPVMPIE